MSEHDSSWASGGPDDRVAGQSPRLQSQQDEQHRPPVPAGAPAPTTSQDPSQAEPPTRSYPTGSYQGGAYPGGSHQPPSHQAPTNLPPAYQGAPYQAQTSAFPASAGAPHPGGPYAGAPAWPPSSYGRDPRQGRVGRGVVIGVAAVALALFSGVTGGLVAHQVDGKGPSTTTITRNAAPVVDRASVAAVAAKVQPSVVDITTGSGEGSGVVISTDGAILTNNHVLEGARGNTVDVTFSNGKTAKATIVGRDPAGDLAVIKAQDVSGLTVAKFGDSDAMQVGDTVLALGSPLGLQGSVTAGIISALHRTIDEGGQGAGQRSIGDALQTDAAINPGNSGGALVNLAGEVIGINTAIATNGQGAGNIGVGFAISSNKAKSTADQLLKGGKVSHPYLGVQVAPGDGGALIADVVAGGPADKAGLRKGDLVTKIGSRAVSDAKTLVGAIQAAKPGDQLQVTITRNGAEQQVTVTLGESS